jgi:DNA-binding response OmpR family regulator
VRVLVVEDDPTLGPLIAHGLRQDHHAVDLAATVADAASAAVTTAYDVVCLDLGLPDGDGLDLCRRLRRGDGLERPRRILALTARDAVTARIEGLDAGADDYLTKPFDFAELLARLRALDRRHDHPGSVIKIDDIEIDLAARHATRRGDRLQLTGREFSVLAHLAKRRGAVVAAEELLEHCWDAHADPFTGSVRVIVSRLRRKLGDPPIIRTHTGSGYEIPSSP